MYILIDKKASSQIKKQLSAIAVLIELDISDVAYPAIQGHPDIFVAKIDNKLIISQVFLQT